MKQCSKCGRSFGDDSLNFCLDDGSPLLTEPVSEPTLISPTIAAYAPAARSTIASDSAQRPHSSYRLPLFAGIVLVAMLLGGAAVAFLYQINKWDSPRNANSMVYSATPVSKPSRPLASPTVEGKPAATPNLSGEWNLVNTIERTSYPAYTNLRLGYHITIRQTGTEFAADGQKFAENGIPMDDSERTPIHINGSIDENNARATFVEEGIRRKTTGKFEWRVSSDGNRLRGTFVSTAAKSSGSSDATREK